MRTLRPSCYLLARPWTPLIMRQYEALVVCAGITPLKAPLKSPLISTNAPDLSLQGMIFQWGPCGHLNVNAWREVALIAGHNGKQPCAPFKGFVCRILGIQICTYLQVYQRAMGKQASRQGNAGRVG